MRPSALPRARDQVLRHLTDPTSPLRAGAGETNQAGLDAEASRLRIAELYWASADMAALAMSAGTQLAAARWATADRPAPAGLIVYDGGIGMLNAQGVEIPVEAISWGAQDGALGVALWVSRARINEQIAAVAAIDADQTPPLLPIRSYALPISRDPTPFAALSSDAPLPVLQALAATWLLIQQPTLAEQRTEAPDKATARAYGRRQQPAPQVSVIDLRRAYAPDGREETGEAGGRYYRNRWVVRGHWRDQPYGPERAQRRQQWIPAHIKGPDGAPLLATERVNVWRR
jgi:hypothetical protein